MQFVGEVLNSTSHYGNEMIWRKARTILALTLLFLGDLIIAVGGFAVFFVRGEGA